MRKTGILLLVSTVLIVLLVSGVALAAIINGTNGNDKLVGTDKRDIMKGRGGHDEMRGLGGRSSFGPTSCPYSPKCLEGWNSRQYGRAGTDLCPRTRS